MAIGEKQIRVRPIALIILFALHKTKALVLHGQPSFSLDTPQVVARAEQAVTFETYTGNEAVCVLAHPMIFRTAMLTVFIVLLSKVGLC